MTQDAADRSKRVLAALVREYIASGEPVASSLLVTRGRAGRVVRDRAEHPGAARRRGLRPAAAHLGRPHPDRSRLSLLRRPAARVEAAEPRGDRGRSAAAARQPATAARFAAAAGRRTCCRRRRRASASRSGRRTKRRCSIASSSCRSARTRVLVVIVASGGHVIQKVIEIGEPLDADELRQAANYPERRVLRPAAAPRARSGARADQRGAAALRRAARARHAAGDVDLFGSARRPHDVRRRRLVAARRRAAG